MINRIIAFLLLIAGSPIFLIIIICVILEDGFPVFFKQKRVGINNKLFWIYKFRSMRKNTPNVATHLLDNPDQYVLKTGKWIRKLSLDELPNLFNIIMGDMVFVGPRPALFNQYDLIELRTNKGIDSLKPGITGWAQINGRDEISIPEKVDLDAFYLKERSLLFDCRIILTTIFRVFSTSNVSH